MSKTQTTPFSPRKGEPAGTRERERERLVVIISNKKSMHFDFGWGLHNCYTNSFTKKNDIDNTSRGYQAKFVTVGNLDQNQS